MLSVCAFVAVGLLCLSSVLRMVMAQANPQLAMSLRNELDGTPQRGLLDGRIIFVKEM